MRACCVSIHGARELASGEGGEWWPGLPAMALLMASSAGMAWAAAVSTGARARLPSPRQPARASRRNTGTRGHAIGRRRSAVAAELPRVVGADNRDLATVVADELA